MYRKYRNNAFAGDIFRDIQFLYDAIMKRKQMLENYAAKTHKSIERSRIMIEIVYDKNESQETVKGADSVRLPKNIRQVGQPSGNRKIYIEDYVVTYLNRLAKPSNTYSRGAILLGEYKKSEKGEVLFISGAIEAQNLELDLDETVFTNETWSEIYETTRSFFPELSVVGWFLSRLGFSTGINDKIVKTHLDNFPGRDKVLYIIDALEGDDVFYLYEGNGLRKQLGYYIYYTKNEAMQNYMIGRDVEADDVSEEAEQKDEELLTTYHEMLSRNKRKPEPERPQLIYVASSVLAVAVLALGVTVLNSYDRMKSLEVSLNRVELAVQETRKNGSSGKEAAADTSETKVVQISANITTEADSSAQEIGSSAVEGDTSITTQKDGGDTSHEGTTDNTEEPEASVVMKNDTPVYYTVKEGDTLTSISLSVYRTTKYVDKIIEANNLENGDDIYIGQKILIPTVP